MENIIGKENKKLFAKYIRETCGDSMYSLAIALKEIASYDHRLKVYIRRTKNSYDVYFDDFVIYDDMVLGYYEGVGKRTYRSVKQFSYSTWIDRSSELREFTVDDQTE